MNKPNRTPVECLEIFNERVERIRPFSLMQTLANNGSKLNLSWTAKSGKLSVSLIGPNTEQTDAVLYSLRLFVQDKDGISVRDTAKLYDTLSVSSELKNAFKLHKDELNHFFDSPCTIKVNGYCPARRELFHTIVYGDGAHIDQDKRLKLQSWISSPLVGSFIKLEFISIISMFLQTLTMMAEINRRALTELKSRSISSSSAVDSGK